MYMSWSAWSASSLHRSFPPPFWVIPAQQLLWLHKCLSCQNIHSVCMPSAWACRPRLSPLLPPSFLCPLLWTCCHAVCPCLIRLWSAALVAHQALTTPLEARPLQYIHKCHLTIPGPQCFFSGVGLCGPVPLLLWFEMAVVVTRLAQAFFWHLCLLSVSWLTRSRYPDERRKRG